MADPSALVRVFRKGVSLAGKQPGAYEGGPARIGRDVPIPGVLAGSRLTMDTGLQNAIHYLKLELPQAVALLSTTPPECWESRIERDASLPVATPTWSSSIGLCASDKRALLRGRPAGGESVDSDWTRELCRVAG